MAARRLIVSTVADHICVEVIPVHNGESVVCVGQIQYLI